MTDDDFESSIEFDDISTSTGYSISRRDFIAASGASTLSTAAWAAGGGEDEDDVRLDFTETTDEETETQVLVISLVVRKATEDPDEPVFTHENVWKLRPDAFGPDAKFILNKRNDRTGAQRLRVVNVGYGRLRRRSYRFDFRLRDCPIDANGTTRKRMAMSVWTSVWSSERGPTRLNGFSLSPEARIKLPGNALTFREFVEVGTAASFGVILHAKRVSNTAVLMFNGAIGLRTGRGKSFVSVKFTPDTRWNVTCNGHLTVFGQRLPLKTLEVFWPPEQDERRQAALFGSAEVDDAIIKEEVGTGNPLPFVMTLGGRSGPSVRLINQDDLPLSPVLLRSQPLDPTREKGRIRAEVLFEGKWQIDRFRIDDVNQVGPLPMLSGSLLERIDAPATYNATNYAEREGTISFQGEYRESEEVAPEGYVRTVSPIGPLWTTGIRRIDLGDDEERPDFPARRGWPVTALFSWSSAESRVSRDEPKAEIIEAQVALVEAGVRLPEAEYSRLTFQDTELRVFYAAPQKKETPPLPPRIQPLGSYINLGGIEVGPPARLDLERATLRASQSHHLLALKFRFSDLALDFKEGAVSMVRATPLCQLATKERNGPGDLEPKDNRATLVVEFPPQHMFEEAKFFRGRLPMPEVKLDFELTVNKATGEVDIFEPPDESTEPPRPPRYKDDADRLFKDLGDRIAFDSDNRVHVTDALEILGKSQIGDAARQKFREGLLYLKSRTTGLSEGSSEEARRKDFAKFAREVLPALKKLTGADLMLPESQTVYIGPFAMDVDAMREVRKVFDGKRSRYVNSLVNRTLKDAAEAHAALTSGTPPTDFDTGLAHEFKVQGSVPQYQQFRTFYREKLVQHYFDPNILSGTPQPASLAPEETEFLIAAATTTAPFPPLSTENRRKWFKAVKAKFISDFQGRDNLAGPSRGRLANPSRLAFRIDCADGLDDLRQEFDELDLPDDYRSQQPRREVPFTLSGLTNFRGMELAVTNRAEIVFDPGQLGQIASRGIRVADTSSGAMLRRLDFTLGKDVRVVTRLAEIAASMKPPTRLETAIEMPARLTLSPHQAAVVLTPNPVADIFDYIPEGNCDSLTGSDAERASLRLWAAQFVTEADGLGLDPGLRAVYSPDLRPDALLTRFPRGEWTTKGSMSASQPPGGPVDPLFLDRLQSETSGMSEGDVLADLSPANCDTEPNLLPRIVRQLCERFGAASPPKQRTFRTSLDARDRHQLVMLSSAWGMPIVAGDQNSEPQSEFALADIWPGNGLYKPPTLSVTELSLTSLGGNLRHDSSFQPPTGARYWRDRAAVFDAFTVERWQHWINLGRDVFSEVVYKGFLFPLGIRASLVKVTERIFWMDPGTKAISAPLRQRLFIRVANPEKLYPAIKQPFQGRRFPVRRLNLLTTVTPDIVDPYSDSTAVGTTPSPSGRLKFDDARGLVFWPRVLKSEAGNIRFEMDIDGVKTDLPLVFADQTAVDDHKTMTALVGYYNGLSNPDAQGKKVPKARPDRDVRTVIFHGAERRYAPEEKSGSATYQTEHWTLRATGGGSSYAFNDEGELKRISVKSNDYDFGAVRQSADQPPFYPAVETARIHLTPAERLVGRPLEPVRVAFDAHYIVNGFNGDDDEDSIKPDVLKSANNPNEVMMVIRDHVSLDMGSKGDQSGGVFRPSGYVVGLSRQKGAMTQAESRTPTHGDDPIYLISPFFSDYDPVMPGSAPATSPHSQSGAKQLPEPLAEPRSGPDEALEKLRKLYKDMFSDDAKILGLVSIKQLIELIQQFSDPGEGIPDLSEQMEFGGGMAANVLRDRVISPLATSVRRVLDEWDDIERKIASTLADTVGKDRIIRIRDVFPELYASLTDLGNALARAEGEDDPVLFTLEVGACFTAGQRFLDAVQRAAANPGQRIEEAVSEKFGEVLSILKLFESGLDAFLRGIILKVVFDTDDPKEVSGKIEKAVGDYVKETVNGYLEGSNTILSRAVLSLPSPAGGGDRDDFLDCIAALLPRAEDVQKIVRSAVNSALDQALGAAVMGTQLPAAEVMVRRWLETTDPIVFDKKPDDVELIYGNLIEAIEEAKKAFADELSSPLDDLSDQAFDELKKQLEDDQSRLFEEVGGKLQFRSGTVAQQIQNRYFACLLINFATDPDEFAGCLVDIDPTYFREFVSFLRSLLRRPDIPSLNVDISRYLKPLTNIIKALARLLKGIREVRLPDIFGALADLFDELGIPLPDIRADDVCALVDAVWPVVQTVLREAGSLGEATRICPADWQGQTQAAVTKLIDNEDYADALPAGSDTSLCRALIATAIEVDKLHALVVDDTTGAIKDAMKRVEAKLVDLPSSPGVDAALAQVRKAVKGGEETGKCLEEIRAMALDTYGAIFEDMRALNQILRDMALVRDLQLCDAGSIKVPEIEKLQALVNLPRDVRALGDARGAMLTQFDRTVKSLAAKLEHLQKGDTEWIAAIPLAVGTVQYLKDLGVFDSDGNVPSWAVPLTAEIKALEMAADDVAPQIEAFLKEAVVIICRVAQLSEEVLSHVHEARDQLKIELDKAEQAVAVVPGLVGILKRLRAGINFAEIDAALAEVDTALEQVKKLHSQLCNADGVPKVPTTTIEDIISVADVFGTVGEGEGQLGAIGVLSETQRGVTNRLTVAVEEIRPMIEQGPRDALHGKIKDFAVKLLKQSGSSTVPGADVLVAIYDELLKGRNTLHDELNLPILQELQDQVIVFPGPTRRAIPTKFMPAMALEELGIGNDQLAGDAAWLRLVSEAGTTNLSREMFDFLIEFVEEWVERRATPILILEALGEAVEDIFSGDVLRFIDFARLRKDFEEHLLALVPSRLRMGYGFDIFLGKEVAAATAGIFRPGPTTALGIDMKIEVDLAPLLTGKAEPQIDFVSIGTLGPFEVKLVGDLFDALTLRFSDARFESKSGQKPRFDVTYIGHKIGPKLKFVEKLQKFLAPKDGSGAILRFDGQMPGVEAGYRLQLGDFSVGNLAFSNVGLEATAVLPFSDGEALFRASLSSRASPFTLTYAPYGGSGFFAILANVEGIVGFEAGFEFGGSAVFAFGPLSGKGRLMTGLYIRQLKMNGVKITEISMTFFAGGSASIWIFNFAAALSLKMGMVNGAMTGEATFSFSFSMGLADFEYSVSMQKSEGQGFSGQQTALAGKTRFASLGGTSASVPENAYGASVSTDASCQSENWRKYKRYFKDVDLPEGYF